jgi:hypothetical protein
LFKPLPSSLSRQLYGLLTGQHAEFVDPNFIARSDGREGAYCSSFILEQHEGEACSGLIATGKMGYVGCMLFAVTRVQGCGTATVRLNVLTRDMAVAGYSEEGAMGGKIGEDGSRHLG